MTIRERLLGILKGQGSPRKADTPSTYPGGLALNVFTGAGPDQAEKVPFQKWDFERIELYYLMSDILRTTVKALVDETFRNGIEIEPAFKYKCATCGTTFDLQPDVCPICGGTEFRTPDLQERKTLEDWLTRANSSGMNLTQVLEALDYTLNVFDNAYLVVIKRYYYDQDGNINKTEPVDVMVGDPKLIDLIISRDGRLGYDDFGNTLWFCPAHRDELVKIPEDQLPEQGKPRCPKCGKTMLRAYYAWRGWYYNMVARDTVLYYSGDEILHVKKWEKRPGYGVSPIYTLIYKVRTLLRMDYFMMRGYEFERPPLGILILRGDREQINASIRALREEVARNPATIPVLVVESFDKDTGKIAEWIDLGFHPQEWDLIQLRKEFRRAISAMYGVAPVFYEVEYGRKMDATTGMIVTNRAIEAEHKLFNTVVFPWLLRQLGIRDWRLRFKKPELRDDKTRLEILEREVRIASSMVKLCYEPRMVKTEDGFTFVYEKIPDCTPSPQASRELTRHQGGEYVPERDNARAKERYYEENPPGPGSREREGDQRFQGEPEVVDYGG